MRKDTTYFYIQQEIYKRTDRANTGAEGKAKMGNWEWKVTQNQDEVMAKEFSRVWGGRKNRAGMKDKMCDHSRE